jgi:hypothetical protein
MNGDAQADPSVPREACELITCVLPEDGTEKELIPALRDEKQIIRANSVSGLGMAVLADARTKFGELPEPTLVRKVDVVDRDPWKCQPRITEGAVTLRGGARLAELSLESRVGDPYIPRHKLRDLPQKATGTQQPEIDIPVLQLVDELFELVKTGIEYDPHNS